MKYIRGHRKMSWTIAIWTGLFAYMAASTISAASDVADTCVGQYTSACQAGSAIGGGLALTFIGILWFVGFITLSLVWFMTRGKGQQVAAA